MSLPLNTLISFAPVTVCKLFYHFEGTTPAHANVCPWYIFRPVSQDARGGGAGGDDGRRFGTV